MTGVNVPFVNGLSEMVEGKYVSIFPNRRARRMDIQKDRLTGNGKTCKQLISRVSKTEFERYFIRVQRVGGKNILHYDLPANRKRK